MTNSAKIVYWQSSTHWLGYFEEFPDYWTQGETLEELKTMLRSLYLELSDGHLPQVRRHEDLLLV
jgi:predicted RNase H-like HicB family nuclease